MWDGTMWDSNGQFWVKLPHNMGCDEKMEKGRGGGKKEQKRRPKPRDGTQLYCGVCSDKALGYNFDAITCESCKAFFRRNANKTKPFSCSFDGNCKLDPHTRKFCSGCRLKKCFAIGMKREWILSDEQLAKRRSRLRLRSATSSTTNPSEQQESPSSSGDISTSCSSLGDSPPPTFQGARPTSPKTQQVKDEEVEDENYSIPLRRDIEENLHMMHKTYNEIFEATYTPEQSKNLKESATSSSDLFNMTDIFIRRLIRFAKCIPEFKMLKQEDQIHLLKGGVMEMFVLRSAMAFDLKKGGWKYRAQQQSGSVTEGHVNAQTLNSNLGNKMYSDHMTFIMSIHQLTNGDRIVLMLLFVIGLMAADRSNLVNKALVSQAQEKFSMWLRAYLESIHTIAEAQVLYPKLMMKLIDVRHLGEASSQLAATLDISRLEPLLVEVFDLKH